MEVRRPRVDDYDWIRTYPRVIESWSEQTAYLRIHALVTYYGPAYYWTLRFKGAGAESMFLRLTHSGEPEWYQAMNGQRGVRYEKASDGRFTRVPGTKPEADRTWGEARITVPRSILPEPPIDLVVRMDHLPAIKLDDLGKIQRLSYIQDFTLQPLAHED